MNSFFRELKRRNVVRMAGLYLVAHNAGQLARLASSVIKCNP